MFEPFTRVQLHGLSRQALNGSVVLVLPPDNAAEAESLEKSGRVKVSSYPTSLSLKPENLVPAPPPNFVVASLPFAVLEVVEGNAEVLKLCSEMGDELAFIRDVCDLDDPWLLASALWQVYGRFSPECPRRLPQDLQTLVLDTPGHWLYWLGLDQIDHHIVIEACDGTWRGYQASRRARAHEGSDMTSHGGVVIQVGEDRQARGYTARQWVASDSIGGVELEPDPQILDEIEEGGTAENAEHSSEPVGTVSDASDVKIEKVDPDWEPPAAGSADSSAHQLWGRGRSLERAEVHRILNLVIELQAQAKVIAANIHRQIGEANEEAGSVWAHKALERSADRGVTMTPEQPITPRSGEADGVFVFSHVEVKPPFDICIPTRLAFPFMRKFARLTGEYPTGEVFLKMVEFIQWETEELEDGSNFGWTIRAADLRGGGE